MLTLRAKALVPDPPLLRMSLLISVNLEANPGLQYCVPRPFRNFGAYSMQSLHGQWVDDRQLSGAFLRKEKH